MILLFPCDVASRVPCGVIYTSVFSVLLFLENVIVGLVFSTYIFSYLPTYSLSRFRFHFRHISRYFPYSYAVMLKLMSAKGLPNIFRGYAQPVKSTVLPDRSRHKVEIVPDGNPPILESHAC